ncbi:SDR family oxidoreductase [Verticiella sediminum]|uniref:SDR family oxidoreductase n=1 Tax=Verticiella sediminum TaxID=1247510 RepID=A0A556AWT8_9BURK|nr:SDR family oxidoreductase [Verticiella sediminum]
MKDKVAVVIGAGCMEPQAGIGATCAELYAREGAKVLCADLSLKAARATAERIVQAGGQADAMQVDVGDAGQLRALRDKCMELYGRSDVLHNNVGIWDLAPLEDISEASWDRVMDINVKGALLAIQIFLPDMLARAKGSVINTSSIASKKWGPTPFLAYYTSKAALNQMTRVLARQYAEKGVRFNLVLPGLIDTPHAHRMAQGGQEEIERLRKIRDSRCPMGFQGQAMDIAHAALFLACDESRYVTGLELMVDGGLSL